MSRYHAIFKIQCMIIEPRDAAFTFVGILLLSTYMQSRMANIYNLQCIYRLHNLNIQLALSEYERQIRQSRLRRRYNQYRWHLPRPNGSWFEIHYRNRAIPHNYFKSQLRMKRDTFDVQFAAPFSSEAKHLVA